MSRRLMPWLDLSFEVANEFAPYVSREAEVLNELNRRAEYKRIAWNEWHREYRRQPEIKAKIRESQRKYFQELKANPDRYEKRKAYNRAHPYKRKRTKEQHRAMNRRYYLKRKALGWRRTTIKGRTVWVRPSTTDVQPSALSVVNRW